MLAFVFRGCIFIKDKIKKLAWKASVPPSHFQPTVTLSRSLHFPVLPAHTLTAFGDAFKMLSLSEQILCLHFYSPVILELGNLEKELLIMSF